MKENEYTMTYNTGKIAESTDGFNWTITQSPTIMALEEKIMTVKMPVEIAKIYNRYINTLEE